MRDNILQTMDMNDFEMQMEINNLQQQDSSCKLQDTFSDNHYGAVVNDGLCQKEAESIVDLQNLLKTENLLLEYEERRKNERMKEIEYVYTNGYNNYLWEKNKKKAAAAVVIINHKDMLQLDESLPQELDVFRRAVLSMKMDEVFDLNQKCNHIFLRDFFNFYPNWQQHISAIIKMELSSAKSIENAFQSEYTFPSKVLSSLKYSSGVELFCAEIFTRPLKEILNYNEELNLNFYNIYESWLKFINSSTEKGPNHHLHKFINQDGNSEIKNLKKLKEEVSAIMGVKQPQGEKLISEMAYFSQNKEAIKHLLEEIGEQEIFQNDLNIKLAVLVWKKIMERRKKIESILTAFIDQILNSYAIFPKQVKFVMKEYHRQAKNKFGEVKYDDLKSFFNKVIYSQLLLPEFMRLLDEENGVETTVKNFNISHLALFSQKILYGQEFYQKQKYSYFNQLINHYAPQIKEFMMNFMDEVSFSGCKRKEKFISSMLLSFESIKFLYESMRSKNAIPGLTCLGQKISTPTSFQFGSSRYKPQDIYVIFINSNDLNYQSVLKPRQKIKRIFIEFLMQIEKIPHPVSLKLLTEQYKYTTSESELHSIELQANYLSLIHKQFDVLELCEEIKGDIRRVKKQCEMVKIQLEKQYNTAQNMEKIYMNKLKEKQNYFASISIKSFIHCILESPSGLYYGLHDNKVCELEGEGPTNTLGKCLTDISEYYLKKYEGYDGLFVLLLERINEEVENQGIIDEATCKAANNLIGARLYELIRLSTNFSEKDQRILEQMKKHAFVNLQILELSQYEDEEELILENSLPLLQKLKIPQSPQQLLNIFYQVTMVFQNIILITGKSSDITADVQIPLMLLILIKSKIPNLSTILNFIEKFSSDEIHSSIMGQTLTLMSSACYLIETMAAKQLNLPQEKYQELCREQFQRAKAEHDRQYLIIEE